MGRTSDARQRLVDAARELIHADGYNGVGVGELCAQAGVQKGSFYHFFESKQALTVAAIHAHGEDLGVQWSAALNGKAAPLTRLDRLLRDIHRTHSESRERCGYMVGCMLGNLTLERGHRDELVRDALRKTFDEQLELLRAVLEEAQARGELVKGVSPMSGARSLLALLEGSVLVAKLRDDPAVLRGVAAQARRLVAS